MEKNLNNCPKKFFFPKSSFFRFLFNGSSFEKPKLGGLEFVACLRSAVLGEGGALRLHGKPSQV